MGGLRLVSVVKWLRGGEVDQREKDVEDFSEPGEFFTYLVFLFL